MSNAVRTIVASMVAEVEGGLKLWTDEGVVVVRLPRSAGARDSEPREEERVRVVRPVGAPRRLQGGKSAQARASVARAIDLWAEDLSLGVTTACEASGTSKAAWDYHTRRGGSLRPAYLRAELARKVALEASV